MEVTQSPYSLKKWHFMMYEAFRRAGVLVGRYSYREDSA